MTRTEQIDVTARAIAQRLKGRALDGDELLRAIEEVADDLNGQETIAGEFLAADHIYGDRDWPKIVRRVKAVLASFDA
jgi:hypothetical protein